MDTQQVKQAVDAAVRTVVDAERALSKAAQDWEAAALSKRAAEQRSSDARRKCAADPIPENAKAVRAADEGVLEADVLVAAVQANHAAAENALRVAREAPLRAELAVLDHEDAALAATQDALTEQVLAAGQALVDVYAPLHDLMVRRRAAQSRVDNLKHKLGENPLYGHGGTGSGLRFADVVTTALTPAFGRHASAIADMLVEKAAKLLDD